MSTKQVKFPSQSEGIREVSGTPPEIIPEPEVRNPRQDFVFAVKLFGITGLIIVALWLMNQFVS